MKTCAKCGAEFPATSEFFKPSKLCVGGLTRTCRPCAREYMKRWKAENRPRISERRRHLYADRHTEAHARKRREALARAPRRSRAKLMRAGMIERSRKRELPFDEATFTVDWLERRLIEQPNCPCCREAMDVSFKHDGLKNDRSPSIDRLRPAGGYVVGNVEIICWRCNNLKRDATAAELRMIVDWMESAGLG